MSFRLRFNPRRSAAFLLGMAFSLEGNAVVGICNPNHKSGYGDFSPLIHRARVYGAKDRRREFTTKVAEEMKFSKQELNQLNKMTGSIYCAPEPGIGMAVGTAFIMGSAKQHYTAGHMFTTDDGRRRDLSKCKFINYANPRETYALDADNAANKLPTWSGDVGRRRYDRAIIQLKKPVAGAKPLASDPSPGTLNVGDPLYMFASQHNDFDSSGNRPVVSSCNAGQITDAGEGVSQLPTDCDSGKGASGGPVIARRNGQLLVEGMNVAEGNPYISPNAPFDQATNYQIVLSVKGPLLK